MLVYANVKVRFFGVSLCMCPPLTIRALFRNHIADQNLAHDLAPIFGTRGCIMREHNRGRAEVTYCERSRICFCLSGFVSNDSA